MTDHDDKTILKRMFPNYAGRIDAEKNGMSPMFDSIRRNLSSSAPELHRALSSGRKDMLGLMSMPNGLQMLPVLGKALEEAQKSWQKPLAVSAFSSSLGLANSLLPKLPPLALPTLSSPIKLPTIDWHALQARDERALRFAAQNNWFVQPESYYSITADIDACSSDAEQLDRLFCEEIRGLKDRIRKRLLDDHPTRSSLIDEMFRLHDEQRYIASIPLALIVSEGLALDVADASIFNVSKNRPEIARWLDKQQLSGVAKAYMASLSERHPMSTPRKGKLSRHLVLHGRDTNYGSEVFSLQAISLLGFVGWAFTADGPALDKS